MGRHHETDWPSSRATERRRAEDETRRNDAVWGLASSETVAGHREAAGDGELPHTTTEQSEAWDLAWEESGEELEDGADLNRQRRWGGWGQRAVLVLLVLAAGFGGWRLTAALTNRGDSGETVAAAGQNAHPTLSVGPSEGGTGSGQPSAPSAPGVSGTPGGTARVHVVGAVRKAGVYTLPPGARLADAIEAAGGPTSGADTSLINLAAPVEDGTQVRVLRRGERPSGGASGAAPGGTDPAAGGTGAPRAGTASGSGSSNEAGAPGGGSVAGNGAVRINSASATELQALPGIGPAMSARIIEWREKNGPLRSSADLDAIPGIGPAMLAKLDGLVRYD